MLEVFDSAAAVSHISEFEIFEASHNGGTYDLSFLNAQNEISGLSITNNRSSNIGTFTTVINNINFDSARNIKITPPIDSRPFLRDLDTIKVILNAENFHADGGISDSSTITLDNNQFLSSGINADVTFASLDFLHLVSKSNGFGKPDENKLELKATDLDEIKITGDESLSLFLNARPSEIDASGLDAPFTFGVSDSIAIPFTSRNPFEVTGTTYDDSFNLKNIATDTSFLLTGGGSDLVFYDGKSTETHFMIFTATELNAGDLKAGDSTVVRLEQAAAGAKVTIVLTSELEGLLKSGGTFLTETNDNINIHGTSLSNTTNIAAQSFNTAIDFGGSLTTTSTLDLQFDLNGDGNYSAPDDARIRFIGDNSDQNTFNDTLVYDAVADTLIYTVV